MERWMLSNPCPSHEVFSVMKSCLTMQATFFRSHQVAARATHGLLLKLSAAAEEASIAVRGARFPGAREQSAHGTSRDLEQRPRQSLQQAHWRAGRWRWQGLQAESACLPGTAAANLA